MSGEDLGWAISTLASRASAVWRFRLFVLLLPVGTFGIALAATELRMESLWWLVAVVGAISLVGGVAALRRGPSIAEVVRAHAVLQSVVLEQQGVSHERT
ncbi:MAG: hypothetical protein V4850_12570 [Myxococcota bacterium]